MRRKLPIVFPVLLLLFCAKTRTTVDTPDRITIFHTNDVHAGFLPREATWRDDRPLIGGFGALDFYLRGERATAPHSLYLDAGDFLTGNPISNVEHNGAMGGALVALYCEVGLDAMALGNHEFDHPRENTLALLDLAGFPILAANLRGFDGSLFTGQGYEIFDVGGVRVGVIGVTTGDLGELIGTKQFAGLHVTPAVEVLQGLVPEVDAVTDLIVVLSHEGIETDRTIAQTVSEIDVIVGGHSHTRLERGEWVDDVLIVQAGSNLRYLGRIDLTVQNDEAVDVQCHLIPLWAKDATGSEKVRSLVRGFEAKIEEEYGLVIGEAATELGRDHFAESDLGNWITDRMRDITGADVAFLNSGGIRRDLQAGPVRKLDIQEIVPFSNLLCTFTCTGEKLLEIIEGNLDAGVNEDHGVLQTSGVKILWGQSGDKIWIVEANLRDSRGGYTVPVDETKIYTVATVDYVARSQPEKYLGYVPSNVKILNLVLTDAIMAEMERIGFAEAPKERRMIQQKQVDPAATGTGGQG